MLYVGEGEENAFRHRPAPKQNLQGDITCNDQVDEGGNLKYGKHEAVPWELSKGRESRPKEVDKQRKWYERERERENFDAQDILQNCKVQAWPLLEGSGQFTLWRWLDDHKATFDIGSNEAGLILFVVLFVSS